MAYFVFTDTKLFFIMVVNSRDSHLIFPSASLASFFMSRNIPVLCLSSNWLLYKFHLKYCLHNAYFFSGRLLLFHDKDCFLSFFLQTSLHRCFQLLHCDFFSCVSLLLRVLSTTFHKQFRYASCSFNFRYEIIFGLVNAHRYQC